MIFAEIIYKYTNTCLLTCCLLLKKRSEQENTYKLKQGTSSLVVTTWSWVQLQQLLITDSLVQSANWHEPRGQAFQMSRLSDSWSRFHIAKKKNSTVEIPNASQHLIALPFQPGRNVHEIFSVGYKTGKWSCEIYLIESEVGIQIGIDSEKRSTNTTWCNNV